jgi:hypothetical protein
MDPTTIPWYRSQVFASALVSIITQAAVLFGVADKVAPAAVEATVNAALQLVAVTAAIYSAWARAQIGRAHV